MEKRSSSPTFERERALGEAGFHLVAGVDEVGRGPLAGPVVAAAVILTIDCQLPLRDSKQLAKTDREHLYRALHQEAVAIGVGIVDHDMIDKINILQATFLAMRQAIAALSTAPHALLVDGRDTIPQLSIPQLAIPKGDCTSNAIASASIIAKVTRDRLMETYHERFPAYGFNQHMGYATKIHQVALRKHGPSPIHRLTFLKEIGRPQHKQAMSQMDRLFP